MECLVCFTIVGPDDFLQDICGLLRQKNLTTGIYVDPAH